MTGSGDKEENQETTRSGKEGLLVAQEKETTTASLVIAEGEAETPVVGDAGSKCFGQAGVFQRSGFFLTDVGSLLISSILVGVAVISAHGAFRVPDDLFLDDQEAPGGLFSFLGPATSQPPVIVSHV
ncbi:hypothetical protein R1flu_003925 [Riccia fluitans]|uniref:Uncharacterized protein n=1 Tax=Riccia fluitans TaxID=41844 RepID=A0ABD1XDM2_9MARC